MHVILHSTRCSLLYNDRQPRRCGTMSRGASQNVVVGALQGTGEYPSFQDVKDQAMEQQYVLYIKHMLLEYD